jgi:drug/metabolite transporter (DMT)-like permease
MIRGDSIDYSVIKEIKNNIPAMAFILVLGLMNICWALTIYWITPSIISLISTAIIIAALIHSFIRIWGNVLFSEKIEMNLAILQIVSQAVLILCYIVWVIQNLIL